jgi:probable phosphoglycerate mutase
MGWPKLLVLVRHAESIGNIKSVNERARYDVPSHAYALTPRGKKQAEITGQYLHDRFGEFDIYYISYYLRSQQTMKIMYPEAKVYEDPRLAEGQRGIWHTLTDDEIAVLYPHEIERRDREGLYHFRPLGGENWPDMELRIHSFLGTLNRDCEDQKVLMVVHGHWLVLFQRLIHHFSIGEALLRYHEAIFSTASVTVYESRMINGKSRLILNEENINPWEGKV